MSNVKQCQLTRMLVLTPTAASSLIKVAATSTDAPLSLPKVVSSKALLFVVKGKYGKAFGFFHMFLDPWENVKSGPQKGEEHLFTTVWDLGDILGMMDFHLYLHGFCCLS